MHGLLLQPPTVTHLIAVESGREPP
jgi:hypothetical protein